MKLNVCISLNCTNNLTKELKNMKFRLLRFLGFEVNFVNFSDARKLHDLEKPHVWCQIIDVAHLLFIID